MGDPAVDNVGPYGGGWCCDVCMRFGPATEANYRDTATSYDLCEECYKKCVEQFGKEKTYGAPIMVLLNFKAKKFYFAAEGAKECNEANIKQMIADYTDNKLTEGKLQM